MLLLEHVLTRVRLVLGVAGSHAQAGRRPVGQLAVDSVAHVQLVVIVGGEAPVDGTAAHQSAQAAIRRGIAVLLLVHLLVDDIGLGDSESTASPLLVDLGSPTGGLDPGLKTPVASPGRSDVGTRGGGGQQSETTAVEGERLHTAPGSLRGSVRFWPAWTPAWREPSAGGA